MVQRTVLITGCSKGSIGSALALGFHSRGLRVVATARSLGKMAHLTEAGISTVVLDVTLTASIAECVESVSKLTQGTLDILINNAGFGLSMPITDTPLPAAQDLFNTNFFGSLAVIQAFLPLLLSSETARSYRPMIVNNTSIVSVIPLPFQGVYNASKAALAALTDTLRLELEPFNIDVVDLKTGAVKTQFFTNVRNSNKEANVSNGQEAILPPTSIYTPASTAIGHVTSHAELEQAAMPVVKYAEQVVGDLLRSSSKPPVQVWRGTNALLIWFGRRFLPFTALDKDMRKLGRLDEVKTAIARSVK